MPPIITDAHRKSLRDESALWPPTLTPIPPGEWPRQPPGQSPAVMAWRSQKFLVVLYNEGAGHRLTVNRTEFAPGPTFRWKDGITWDELMKVKAEAGFRDSWAAELYPPDDEVVNVANMRHLWLLKEAPPFGWKKLGDVVKKIMPSANDG